MVTSYFSSLLQRPFEIDFNTLFVPIPAKGIYLEGNQGLIGTKA